MPDIYQVLLAQRVIDYLDRLGHGEREEAFKRIELLKSTPKSVGEPRGKFWILKVGRAGYRIAYRIMESEKVIRVTNIEKRSSWKYDEYYS